MVVLIALVLVEEGETSFLFPLDFFSLPFLIALELSNKRKGKSFCSIFVKERERERRGGEKENDAVLG